MSYQGPHLILPFIQAAQTSPSQDRLHLPVSYNARALFCRSFKLHKLALQDRLQPPMSYQRPSLILPCIQGAQTGPSQDRLYPPVSYNARTLFLCSFKLQELALPKIGSGRPRPTNARASLFIQETLR